MRRHKRHKRPKRERLHMALSEHSGNVKATASSFGVYPVLIYRWLKSFRMDLSDYRGL